MLTWKPLSVSFLESSLKYVRLSSIVSNRPLHAGTHRGIHPRLPAGLQDRNDRFEQPVDYGQQFIVRAFLGDKSIGSRFEGREVITLMAAREREDRNDLQRRYHPLIGGTLPGPTDRPDIDRAPRGPGYGLQAELRYASSRGSRAWRTV